MSNRELSPAEKLKRRQQTSEHGKQMMRDLRGRLPGVPLEMELSTTAPVEDEDGNLFVKTDGTSILRVLGVANDLARDLREREGLTVVARVWPRSIWCRKSARPAAREGEPPAGGVVGGGQLYSARDAAGNTLLCLTNSHSGEHDFSEPRVSGKEGVTT